MTRIDKEGNLKKKLEEENLEKKEGKGSNCETNDGQLCSSSYYWDLTLFNETGSYYKQLQDQAE